MIAPAGRLPTAVPGDEVLGHLLGQFGGLLIAFHGRDDRAFQREVPCTGEQLAVLQPGVFGPGLGVSPDPG
ncbi:hypothetical protein [Arthrobacter globiformis]|uniref:hypothetical protein n=1 Tax=Arthrobacter globiformis TaxID=1665 RepID=UPI0027D845BC|nr:hypothetical protein [Arthrobacter globiformis]